MDRNLKKADFKQKVWILQSWKVLFWKIINFMPVGVFKKLQNNQGIFAKDSNTGVEGGICPDAY